MYYVYIDEDNQENLIFIDNENNKKFIPVSFENRDYLTYKEWLSEGNLPQPYVA